MGDKICWCSLVGGKSKETQKLVDRVILGGWCAKTGLAKRLDKDNKDLLRTRSKGEVGRFKPLLMWRNKRSSFFLVHCDKTLTCIFENDGDSFSWGLGKTEIKSLFDIGLGFPLTSIGLVLGNPMEYVQEQAWGSLAWTGVRYIKTWADAWWRLLKSEKSNKKSIEVGPTTLVLYWKRAKLQG